MDEAAKAATADGIAQHLPISLAATKQLINAECKKQVTTFPSPQVLKRLRQCHDPHAMKRALSTLQRHSATAIAQLRAGHTPLSAFLHCINAVNDPNCPECLQPETTEHHLLLCRKYTAHRVVLLANLRGLQINPSLTTILTNPAAFKPLAEYISATGWFLQARQWKSPLTQTRTQPRTQTQPMPAYPPPL